MQRPVELDGGLVVRELARGDGAALAEAYLRNREHLAPWEPSRTATFFTAEWQESEVEAALQRLEAGSALPLVIVDGDEIVGRVNLSDIVRGVFLNANLGYWVDVRYTGRGLATTAVGVAVHAARGLGLHRVQAGTLVHNRASQVVLERNGFERFGLARRYLRIAGEWQDHVLFERLLED
ncbi:GNAT family N-acetyltransferase [Agromyces sp. SYSU K20354]|uniref:GNAT family N-acetyltransferase n=1 Tax=Agromyces cavernae TaxID=2898659 RepID=UPI001E391F6E|nr:GNAT family N-acetyltransferase [Agromyces cavernae]MCD2441592.1 GNAT family N-acetyltransferase [Agromyces cavernae]